MCVADYDGFNADFVLSTSCPQFAPNSTVIVNITAVAQKMESVLNKLMQMGNGTASWVNFSARFLNTTLWEHANSNLEKWASDTTALFWM